MIKRHFAMACLAASLAITPVTRAAADGDAIVGGIVGGIIGGAIVNEANKNRQKKTVYRKTYRSSSGISAATRAQNREVQTSLNYFGFPAGSVDGVLGSRSRGAISQYQIHMGYPATGQLTPYERDFLVTSYHRAIAGGASTNQLIAANPMGARGLLKTYQQQLATGGAAPVMQQPGTTVVVAPQAVPLPVPAPTTTVVAPTETPTVEAAAKPKSALPNFMGQGTGKSLASHCNKVSLLTNTNGGFTTAASMTDARFALNEQFCLARTYAIAAGEDLAGKVSGLSAEDIAAQCQAMGPVLKDHVAALSLKSRAEVLQGIGGFVLESGMSPAQLSGTAKICLSVGYRTDNMDVAIGSGLLLVALGEPVYAELMGHHLSQGFGTANRADLALDWYEMSLEAGERGAVQVFAPGQPDRSDLIRKAAYQIGGKADGAALPAPSATPQPAALPTFSVEN